MNKAQFERILARERAARKEAERIMEDKSMELYEVNVKLKNLNASLEDEIHKRTQKMRVAMAEAELSKNAERDFLAKMSHEIRTPMNAVVGMTHLMFDTQLNANQKELINSIHYSANLLKSLISDILDLSKIEAGEVKFVERDYNLKELLIAIQKTFSFSLENKPIKVEVEFDDRLPRIIYGDDVIMNQILMNLVGNAAKFTEEGFIKISAFLVSNSEQGSLLELQVQDTGIGIDDASLTQIFDSFKQVDRDINLKYGGTGLGLAITKQLVELSKGQVHVKSDVGVGATFTVTIPLSNCNSQDKNILDNPDEVDLSNSGKILLVEDNLLNQKYSGQLLDKWGLTWDLAENGAIAVEKCNETSYSIILMDIQMPEMNGHEATIQIRSSSNSNANVPIIALSAFAFEHEVSKSINAGMSDHLTKPFAPMDLKKKIAEHLRALPVEASVDGPFTHHEMLDASYLETFYEGDLHCMLEMFEVFIKHVSSYSANFGAAIEAGNWDEVSALAHKLKPIFAMVGLNHKQAIMIRLEKEVGSDCPDLEQIKEGYQEFEDLVEELLPVLKEEVIRIKNFLK